MENFLIYFSIRKGIRQQSGKNIASNREKQSLAPK